MSRQDAFAHLKKDAQEPVKIIPLAHKQKRDNRAWDRAHRGMSYRIPNPYTYMQKIYVLPFSGWRIST